MVEIEFPEGINRYDGSLISFDEINERFANTSYGQILKTRVRFEDGFKPLDAENRIWQEMLGPHGNNYEHMHQTRIEFLDFVQECMSPSEIWFEFGRQPFEFSYEEIRDGAFAAQVHDIQEAVVGDIAKPKKTKKDEEEEMMILDSILDEEFVNDLEPQDRRKMIERVKEILNDEETKMGKVFNAVELLGYSRAALSAWSNLDESESDLQSSLRVLAHQVISSDLQALIKYSYKYPPVFSFLINNKLVISEIIEDSERFGDHEVDFDKVHASWTKFQDEYWTGLIAARY